MTQDQIVVLCVLLGALVLFVTELVPLGVTGLCIIVVLGLAGVLEADAATSAFASPTLILVGSLYVVCFSLIRTGVMSAAGARLLSLGSGSERRLVLVTMLAAAALSALVNNTSVVVMMLPLLLAASQRMGIAPSRLLMPMSYAAILGGTTTLIGTSTNILVADLAEKEVWALEPIGFLEFLPVGLGYLAVGLLYTTTLGRRLLPSRQTISSITRGRAFEYVTELRVHDQSAAAGMTVATLVRRAGERIRILQLIHGEEVFDRFEAETLLEHGDIIVLRGLPEAIVGLQRDLRLDAVPAVTEGEEPSWHGTTFAEIVITPASDLIGRTLQQVGLHRKHGVVALALQRRGAHLRHGIVHVPLRVGDVILVQGPPAKVESLRGHAGFLLLVGVDEHVPIRRRAPIAVLILALFVLFAASGAVELTLLAMAAAATCIITGCVTLRGAARAVDWNVLALLAGSISLGLALHTSGLAEQAGHIVVGLTRDLGPYAVLSAIYLLTSITTEFVSNSGAAALMLPVALATAVEVDVSVRPFIFAVAFGASASFSTPIGYQTNTFILGPGGYRFRDFVRVGTPLQLLLWAYASFAIPLFFPFEPR